MNRRPPRSTPFPDTTLCRSIGIVVLRQGHRVAEPPHAPVLVDPNVCRHEPLAAVDEVLGTEAAALRSALDDAREVDRKSTRLNSSHANISYAVFCLKKKTLY